MPVAANHSYNLPREFEECPECHKKGLYRYGGTIIHTAAGWGGLVPGRRCKYCKHRIPDATQQEYVTRLNRAVAPETVVAAPKLFEPERAQNGAIERLTITLDNKAGVVIDRPMLIELSRLLALDPSLCRMPERKFARMA